MQAVEKQLQAAEMMGVSFAAVQAVEKFGNWRCLGPSPFAAVQAVEKSLAMCSSSTVTFAAVQAVEKTIPPRVWCGTPFAAVQAVEKLGLHGLGALQSVCRRAGG